MDPYDYDAGWSPMNDFGFDQYMEPLPHQWVAKDANGNVVPVGIKKFASKYDSKPIGHIVNDDEVAKLYGYYKAPKMNLKPLSAALFDEIPKIDEEEAYKENLYYEKLNEKKYDYGDSKYLITPKDDEEKFIAATYVQPNFSLSTQQLIDSIKKAKESYSKVGKAAEQAAEAITKEPLPDPELKKSYKHKPGKQAFADLVIGSPFMLAHENLTAFVYIKIAPETVERASSGQTFGSHVIYDSDHLITVNDPRCKPSQRASMLKEMKKWNEKSINKWKKEEDYDLEEYDIDPF